MMFLNRIPQRNMKHFILKKDNIDVITINFLRKNLQSYWISYFIFMGGIT